MASTALGISIALFEGFSRRPLEIIDDRRFRPIADLSVAVSVRYFAIGDTSAVAAWLALVAHATAHPPRGFGLRFAAEFDREIWEAHFRALMREHVDFKKALAQRRTLVTRDRFDPTLVSSSIA